LKPPSKPVERTEKKTGACENCHQYDTSTGAKDIQAEEALRNTRWKNSSYIAE